MLKKFLIIFLFLFILPVLASAGELATIEQNENIATITFKGIKKTYIIPSMCYIEKVAKSAPELNHILIYYKKPDGHKFMVGGFLILTKNDFALKLSLEKNTDIITINQIIDLLKKVKMLDRQKNKSKHKFKSTQA